MRATFRQRVGCRSACSPTWISAMPSVWGSCSGSAKRSWTCTGVSASTLPSSRGMAAGSCPFLTPSWSAMTAGSKPASSTPTSVTACGQRTSWKPYASLPGLSRCRHLLCQARRTGGTTPSLAKVFLPDPLAQALNSPVAIGGTHMSLGTILIIILILILLGVIPTWGHSRGWGYGPSGIVGLILIILLILLLLGKI